MTAEFQVTTTSHFDREVKKVASKHGTLLEIFESVIGTLKTDPYNRSRQYAIKKLEAIPQDEGQYPYPLWTLPIPL